MSFIKFIEFIKVENLIANKLHKNLFLIIIHKRE